MSDIESSLRELLAAKVHLGHRTQLRNPKMKKYIIKEKGGIHIIHPGMTLRALQEAENFIQRGVSQGATVLFVGTKRSSSEIIQKAADECSMYYVNQRWLGGTLTNFSTIKKSVDKLIRMEKEVAEGLLERRTKKERLEHERSLNKMTRSLGGIKTMKNLPDILFVIDPKREHNAIKEANRLKIPVVAICDTNCDPTGIDFVIPGNDDGLESVQLFATRMVEAIKLGVRSPRANNAAITDDAVEAVEE